MERGGAEGGRDGHEQEPRQIAVAPPERPGAESGQNQEEPRGWVPKPASPVDGGQPSDRPAEIQELPGRPRHEVSRPRTVACTARRRASRCPRAQSDGSRGAHRPRERHRSERPQARPIVRQERRRGQRGQQSGRGQHRRVRQPRCDGAGEAEAERPSFGPRRAVAPPAPGRPAGARRPRPSSRASPGPRRR